MPLYENYSLLQHNTFGIDIDTRYFFEYKNENELFDFLSSDTAKKHRMLHIGSGSNILFLNNFDGIILHSAIKGICKEDESEQHITLKVGAGVIWDDFVEYCVKNNFGGIENLSLIPGEAGASAIQNIGAYGVEVKDTICSVETIEIKTQKKRTFSNDECKYSYRQSIFKQELKNKYIVTHVCYRLQKQPIFNIQYQQINEKLKNQPITLASLRKAIIDIRREKLPDVATTGSAGSFFMNPVIPSLQANELKKKYPDMPVYPLSENKTKLSAGWLIEQCGWKGKTLGNAGVYEKQALVLINRGKATGKEIADMANIISSNVLSKFQVEIKPEVLFVD